MNNWSSMSDLIKQRGIVEAGKIAGEKLKARGMIHTELFGWIEKEWWEEALKRDLVGKNGRAFRLPIKTKAAINKCGEKYEEIAYDLTPLTKFREDYENFKNNQYHVQESFEGLV